MKVKLIIICVIFSGLTFGCRNLLSSYESDVLAEVTAHSWRRTIVVEQLETKTAEAWENELPEDVTKIISKRQDVHHYDGTVRREVEEIRTRKVQCGSDYVGGKPPRTVPRYCDEKYTTTVTKDVDDITKPVYATKVKYEFEVWTAKETKDFTGYDKDISKAEMVSVDNKTNRIGKSDDAFRIELKTPDGEKYPQNVKKEIWEKLNEGQKIKCKIDLNKTLSDCEF
jgi:hypothetical protein